MTTWMPSSSCTSNRAASCSTKHAPLGVVEHHHRPVPLPGHRRRPHRPRRHDADGPAQRRVAGGGGDRHATMTRLVERGRPPGGRHQRLVGRAAGRLEHRARPGPVLGVDLRHPDEATKQRLAAADPRSAAERIADERGVSVSYRARRRRAAQGHGPERSSRRSQAAAEALRRARWKPMVSGAGHDSQVMAHRRADGDAVRAQRRGALAQRRRIHHTRRRRARRDGPRRGPRTPGTIAAGVVSPMPETDLGTWATVARETFEYNVVPWAGRRYAEWVRAWSRPAANDPTGLIQLPQAMYEAFQHRVPGQRLSRQTADDWATRACPASASSTPSVKSCTTPSNAATGTRRTTWTPACAISRIASPRCARPPCDLSPPVASNHARDVAPIVPLSAPRMQEKAAICEICGEAIFIEVTNGAPPPWSGGGMNAVVERAGPGAPGAPPNCRRRALPAPQTPRRAGAGRPPGCRQAGLRPVARAVGRRGSEARLLDRRRAGRAARLPAVVQCQPLHLGELPARPGLSLPLAGVRVVAWEHAVAAPLATRHLADLGADVVKVERPGRRFRARLRLGRERPERLLRLAQSRQAQRRPRPEVDADRTAFDRLLDRADVLRPQPGPRRRRAPRLRLRRRSSQRNPKLVFCAISGYGPDGPHRDRKAYDLLLQGEAGVIALTGTPEAPAKVGISVADIASGMYAFSSVLAALYRRQTDWPGRRNPDLDARSARRMGRCPRPMSQATRAAPRARRRRATNFIVPYGAYRVGDGGSVNLAVQNDGQWRRLCAIVLQQPELADDARFRTNELRLHNRARAGAADRITAGQRHARETSRLG